MMDGETSIPEIELIIKASTIDGRRKGACLFCQEYFMDLYLLAELKTISLKITTVDMLKPPPDFRFESLPILAFPRGLGRNLGHACCVLKSRRNALKSFHTAPKALKAKLT